MAELVWSVSRCCNICHDIFCWQDNLFVFVTCTRISNGIRAGALVHWVSFREIYFWYYVSFGKARVIPFWLSMDCRTVKFIRLDESWCLEDRRKEHELGLSEFEVINIIIYEIDKGFSPDCSTLVLWPKILGKSLKFTHKGTSKCVWKKNVQMWAWSRRRFSSLYSRGLTWNWQAIEEGQEQFIFAFNSVEACVLVSIKGFLFAIVFIGRQSN